MRVHKSFFKCSKFCIESVREDRGATVDDDTVAHDVLATFTCEQQRDTSHVFGVADTTNATAQGIFSDGLQRCTHHARAKRPRANGVDIDAPAFKAKLAGNDSRHVRHCSLSRRIRKSIQRGRRDAIDGANIDDGAAQAARLRACFREQREHGLHTRGELGVNAHLQT